MTLGGVGAIELTVAGHAHVFRLHFGALDDADEAIDEVTRFFKRHIS